MNTLQDTIVTLTAGARVMVEKVLPNATGMFAERGEIDPALFVIRAMGDEVNVFETKAMMNDELKPALWEGVRQLRRRCPVVGFISEVWQVDTGRLSKEAAAEALKIMPRDHPDKVEVAMFQLWDGSRQVTFMADIKREPNALGKWSVLFDSFFPKGKMNSLGGAMMDGEPCAQEGN